MGSKSLKSSAVFGGQLSATGIGVLRYNGSNRMYSLLDFGRSPRLDLEHLKGARQRSTTRMIVLRLLLVITTAPWLLTVPAQAQAMRTFVSGLGKDSNACTAAAPCLTLQGALGKTLTGGQIYALDSANYGYVTINKAVSIISGGGATGVLATSSISGITIAAGANDIVNLQGLDIDGAGSGTNGILFNSGGTVNIQNSLIRGFTTGINFQPSGSSALFVGTTLISNNLTGILFQNAATSIGTLNDVQLVNNGSGIVAQGAGSTAVANVTVQSSMVANNSTVGILAGSFSAVSVSNSIIANNGVGLQAQSASALLNTSGSTVTGNGTGWIAANGGQVISASDNPIGGNTAGNTAPPTAPAPPPPTVIAKNIVTDFGARCDGVADDAPAFAAFNTWAKAQTTQVQLTIPSGGVCAFLTSIGARWTKDIKDLVVQGYGSTLTDNGTGAGFHLGGIGLTGGSARLATVAAGELSVKLLTPSQSSLFSIGKYALITGLDLQGTWRGEGYGFPPNPHFFEYVQVTDINSSTGVITFKSPLKNTYKSTWPSYDVGGRFGPDQGGPATLYALDPSWDTISEYRGLTIDQPNRQTYSIGRSVTYRDVTFTGGYCGIPTQNLLWQAINTKMTRCAMEVDKLITEMVLDGVTIELVEFQSSSTDFLTMRNSIVTSAIMGTPKKAVISDSTITLFRPGAWAYGRTDEVICDNCVLPNIMVHGVIDKGINEAGVNNTYTMSGGVIVVPNTQGAVSWAVPGTNLMWRGQYDSQTAFKVVDVTQDANNTYIKTNLSGGFPTLPLTSGMLFIHAHPAPKFTCRNCTGSEDAVDLSQAPVGAPIYSYSKRTYDKTTLKGIGTGLSLWGNPISIGFNVTTSFAGTQIPLLLHGLAPFDNLKTIGPASNYTVTDYGPLVNLRQVGNRVVTLSGVTCNGSAGLCSDDDALTLPNSTQSWFVGSYAPTIYTDVSGDPSNFRVTIEIKTDQGIVNP
jgi:hypothetical protein